VVPTIRESRRLTSEMNFAPPECAGVHQRPLAVDTVLATVARAGGEFLDHGVPVPPRAILYG
jgi:hypothetical protein